MDAWRFARKAGAVLRSALPERATRITYHIDSPTVADVSSTRFVPFHGWAVSALRKPVSVRLRIAGRRGREFPLDRPRPDVVEHFRERLPDLDPECGFSFCLDLDEHEVKEALAVTLEFSDGGAVKRSPTFRLRRSVSPSFFRAHYKEVWNQCAANEHDAKLHVAGYTDEDRFRHVAELTRDMLVECVGVRPDDVVLEIGAGIGRVGRVLAPLCKQWIGADVSENMLAHLRRRLGDFANVRAVALNGYDLSPVPDASVDLVYSTIVFMHLDEWERYSYVAEGFRVLKPGGRMLVDNINLLSDEGWSVFERTMRDYHPLARPAHISKSSTPQELHEYFRRAGFGAIRQKNNGLWIVTWAVKPPTQPNAGNPGRHKPSF